MRRISCGDNLEALQSIDQGTVQLVYLDPPFNSGRTYEVEVGSNGDHRTASFVDSWAWDESATAGMRALREMVDRTTHEQIGAFVQMLGLTSDAAYLAMMAPRLALSHQLLSPEGSLYLHCDSSSSHYLKVLLDIVFRGGFRNEIIWKRTHAHSGSRRFGPVHDTILYYTKTDRYIWNQGYSPYSEAYLNRYFTKEDGRGRYQLITCTGPGDRTGTRAHYQWKGKYPPSGRHWAWTIDKMEELDRAGLLVHSGNGVPRLKRYTTDGQGVRLQDIWTDLNPLGAHSGERTGFDTQKPVALLERIVAASTEVGGLVVDPFVGSGTTAVAAERLDRGWIVADQSLTAASLTLSRVRQEISPSEPVPLGGFPDSVKKALAIRDSEPGMFAAWSASMFGTVVTRKQFSDCLARGVGTLIGADSNEHRVTWVPLKARMPEGLAIPDGDRGDRSFVLGSDSAARMLTTQLEATGINVTSVPLSDCVGDEARSVGSVEVS